MFYSYGHLRLNIYFTRIKVYIRFRDYFTLWVYFSNFSYYHNLRNVTLYIYRILHLVSRILCKEIMERSWNELMKNRRMPPQLRTSLWSKKWNGYDYIFFREVLLTFLKNIIFIQIDEYQICDSNFLVCSFPSFWEIWSFFIIYW